MSKGSRGPADIIATYKNYTKWLIQVKSSTGLAHLKGNEVKRLREASQINGGLAVIATLQPTEIVLSSSITGQTNNNESMTVTKWDDNCRNGIINLGNYAIVFYSLNNWKRIIPNTDTVNLAQVHRHR